jgi:hypothetical protein
MHLYHEKTGAVLQNIATRLPTSDFLVNLFLAARRTKVLALWLAPCSHENEASSKENVEDERRPKSNFKGEKDRSTRT